MPGKEGEKEEGGTCLGLVVTLLEKEERDLSWPRCPVTGEEKEGPVLASLREEEGGASHVLNFTEKRRKRRRFLA